MRKSGGRIVLTGALLVFLGVPSGAGEASKKAAEFLSDANKPLIVAGTAGLYLLGKEKGRKTAEQILVAEVLSQGVTELLKHLLRERRPDGSNRFSFPSGHASSAFTFAGVLAENDRKHQGWYYGGAALIGWSRVELRKHYWWDVVAGAALGIYSARFTRGHPFQWADFSLGGQDFKATLGAEFDGQGLTLLRLTW